MRSIHNQRLYDAMKAYVVKSVHLIAKSGSSMQSQEEEHWVRNSEDIFMRERRPLPISLSLIQDHESTLHSLPEYAECIDALRSADSFSKFWSDIKKIHQQGRRGYLDVALRRFGYAGERHRPEDRVIDLLIAAESLFLNDIENVGELRFRLSLRAAMFIDTDTEEEQIMIYKHMRKAYDVRSTIVHGGSPELPAKPDGTVYSLSEFSEITAEYIRMAIHKVIDLAKNPSAPKNLIDWDGLIFHRGSKMTT